MINKKFWKNKKVLVTGHTGFKGAWLSLWLKQLNARVCGISLDPITSDNFYNAVDIKNIIDVDIKQNIQNYKGINKSIKRFKPEIIFHCAAQSQVLVSYDEPVDTVKSNILGTMNILEILRDNKFIKCAIILTTDKVYKNLNKGLKFKENDELGGDDLYSASKSSADIISQAYIKSFLNKSIKNVGVVRAGNCVGGGDWTIYRIATDCVKAFSLNKKLSIRNPNSTRPWQHLIEPLYGYLLLAQKLSYKGGNKFQGVWNFGPNRSKHLKVVELAKLLRDKMQSTSKIMINKKNNNREKKTLSLNSNKSKKLLGWKTVLSTDETIELMSAWYSAYYKKKTNMKDLSVQQIKFFEKKIIRKK